MRWTRRRMVWNWPQESSAEVRSSKFGIFWKRETCNNPASFASLVAMEKLVYRRALLSAIMINDRVKASVKKTKSLFAKWRVFIFIDDQNNSYKLIVYLCLGHTLGNVYVPCVIDRIHRTWCVGPGVGLPFDMFTNLARSETRVPPKSSFESSESVQSYRMLNLRWCRFLVGRFFWSS